MVHDFAGSQIAHRVRQHNLEKQKIDRDCGKRFPGNPPSGLHAKKIVYYIPSLPPYREYGSVSNEEQDGEAPDTTSNDHRVHERANEEFAELSEGGSIQNVADGMEILILRVLDEPHRTRTHDISASPQ